MSQHANDIVVGPVKDNTVTVKFYGPKSSDIGDLVIHIEKADGVELAEVIDSSEPPTVVVALHAPEPLFSPRDVRISIRNRCRDFFSRIGPNLSNTGSEGDYADLEEDSSRALA